MYTYICTYVCIQKQVKLQSSALDSKIPYNQLKKNRYAQLLNLIYFIFLSIAIATAVAFIN